MKHQKPDTPILRLREALGLNQPDFGRLIGKSGQTVANYEKGIRMGAEVIERLKTLAAEKGFADIALELSSDDWAVQTVVYPFNAATPPPTGAAPPSPADHARWLALAAACLADPDAGPVLQHLLSYFQRTKIVQEPKTRKAGKK